MAHDGFSEDYVISSMAATLVHFSLADSAVKLLYLDVSVPIAQKPESTAVLMKYVKYELQFRVQCGN